MGEFTKSIERLRGQLETYREAKGNILADKNLSGEGKTKKLAELTERSRASEEKATADLWTAMRYTYKGIGAKTARAESAEAQRWDNSRLNIEIAEARARLAVARSVKEIESLYAKALTESHKARAMRIAALETLSSRFLNGGGDEARKANSLINQVQRDDEQARMTPDLRAVQAQAKELIEEVIAAKDLTEMLGKEFYGQPHPLRANDDPFRAQIAPDKLKVNQHVLESDPMKRVTEVEFIESPVAQEVTGG